VYTSISEDTLVKMCTVLPIIFTFNLNNINIAGLIYKGPLSQVQLTVINFCFHKSLLTSLSKFYNNNCCKFEGEVEEEIEQNGTDRKNCWQKIVLASHQYGRSRPQVAIWFFEKTFWMVIYTAGGISTVIYCYGLIQQYIQGNTRFNVAILFNKSIILPDARLCFDLSYGPLFYVQNSKDFEKNMLLSKEMEAYFIKETAIDNRETFLDLNRKWPESLVFASYMYVRFLTEYELNFGQLSIYDGSQFMNDDYNCTPGYYCRFN
jgi:hypothetical protein